MAFGIENSNKGIVAQPGMQCQHGVSGCYLGFQVNLGGGGGGGGGGLSSKPPA